MAATRLLICIALLLQACGQTGPLVYPDKGAARADSKTAPNTGSPSVQQSGIDNTAIPSSSESSSPK